MRRSLLLILIAAACGGKQKSTTPPPPLPEPKAEVKPEEPKEEPKAAEAPVQAGPIELMLASPQVTVKLVSAGKGKKAPLKLTPKTGTKQQVELAIDFRGKSTGLGAPDQEDVFPTFVLTGDAEVKNVDASGNAEYVLTVTGTDARDVAGQKFTNEQAKQVAAGLQGLMIAGTINTNGSGSPIKLMLEKPQPASVGGLSVIAMGFPSLPVLPTEPVGVGAKWKVTSTAKLMEQLEVTQTTDYELVSKKGATYVIKGTTKVSGADQQLGEGGKAKASKITGAGSVEATITDGALYPTMKSTVQTGFTVSGTDEETKQPVEGTLDLKQGATITPKS